MHFSRGPAWRRTSRVRPALIATLIAIPLASGIAVGVIAANHSGTPSSQLKLSAHNFGIGGRLPLATGSAAGTGVALGQTPDQAAASMNCTLQVPAQPAQRAGPGHPLRPGRRLHDVQRQPAGVRRGGHHQPAQRPHQGLQPAGDHPGHPARGSPGRAPAVPRGRGRHHVRLQRRQAAADRDRQLAAAGTLRQRPGPVAVHPGRVLQQPGVLPGRQPGHRPGRAQDPDARHRVRRPGLPDRARV